MAINATAAEAGKEVVRGHVYGPHSRCADLYTDFPAHRPELGMTTVHFGLMMVMNLCVGTITPPVGAILFAGCKIGNVKIEQVIRMLLPFFVVVIVALLFVTFIPALSMALPTALGLTTAPASMLFVGG